jgi:hypothetical protein
VIPGVDATLETGITHRAQFGSAQSLPISGPGSKVPYINVFKP